MKKIYMSMVAMLCSVAAMAQIGTLSSSNVEVTDDATPYLEVLLNAEDVTAISGLQFNLILPPGVSINKYYKEDDEEWVDDVTFPIAKAKHQTGFMAASEGYLFYAAGDNSQSFRTTTNVAVKIGLDVPETFAAGEYLIKFTNVVLSDKSSPIVSYPVDDFSVTLVKGTGINSINAIDSKAPIYNVAGQRVSKAQKGVYIQNGKKVAVK